MNFYVTALIVSDTDKQNVRDIVRATDRDEARNVVFDKYILLGYEVVKIKVVEL